MIKTPIVPRINEAKAIARIVRKLDSVAALLVSDLNMTGKKFRINVVTAPTTRPLHTSRYVFLAKKKYMGSK